jgi:hypothetical protein
MYIYTVIRQFTNIINKLLIVEDPTVTVKCRTAIKTLFLHFNFELLSLGGTASGGEIGAAGTVYLRDIGANPTATKLLIYNQKGNGVSLNVYLINH